MSPYLNFYLNLSQNTGVPSGCNQTTNYLELHIVITGKVKGISATKCLKHLHIRQAAN